MDSVFVIAAHIVKDAQIDLLHKLCQKIKSEGYDYIIASHTNLPDHIIEGSRAFVFDSNNHTIPVNGRDLSKRGYFFYETDEFKIESPFFLHGGLPCRSVSHLHNVYGGILMAKKLQYRYVHFLTYDSTFDQEDIKEMELGLTLGKYDFVGYFKEDRLIGDQFSLSLGKIRTSELLVSQQDMERRIDSIYNDDSQYIMKYLVNELMTVESRDTPPQVSKLLGLYSEPRDNKDLEWALFEEDKDVSIYLRNGSEESIFVDIYGGIPRNRMVEVERDSFFILPIFSNGNYGRFSIAINGVVKENIDLRDPVQKEYWVDSTIVTRFQ